MKTVIGFLMFGILLAQDMQSCPMHKEHSTRPMWN
jgi:hypothetical protein